MGRECGRSASKEASPNFRAAVLGAMCLESPRASTLSLSVSPPVSPRPVSSWTRLSRLFGVFLDREREEPPFPRALFHSLQPSVFFSRTSEFL